MFLIRKYKLLIFVTLVVITFSCRKKREELQDTDTSLAQKYSSVEHHNTDIDNITNEAISFKKLKSFKTSNSSDYLSECAKVIDTVYNGTRFITINFGEYNCFCNDQKQRRGKILITLSLAKGSIEATTVDYYVNNNKIEVSRSLTKTSEVEAKLKSSGTITFSSQQESISEESERLITMTAGFGNNNREDDVFSITGSSTGNSLKGAYTTLITTPLIRKGNCKFISEGVIEITPKDKLPRTLNFGNGECDDVATLSVGNYSKTEAIK